MNKVHNFDEMVVRRGTDAKKYDPSLYGQDVIPMWIADTEFKCPEEIVEAICKRAEHGVYGYPYNDIAFEKAAQRWVATRFNWNIEPNWVEYVIGVIPGVICAVRALSNKGDQIVLQTPIYPPLREAVDQNDRVLLENKLVLENGRYEVDFEDLENKLKDEATKIFILCNPHNPTGRVMSKEELTKIGELCLKYDVKIISDEIHCDLTYNGKVHTPIASINDEIANICTSSINPSKTFNIAGNRIACMITKNDEIRAKIKKEVLANKGQGRTVFGLISFITAYTKCDYYADQLMDYMQINMEFVENFLKVNVPAVKLIKPEATYLLWLDFRELGLTHDELKKFLVEKAKVGLNDGTSFGVEGTGFMRLNIAAPKAVVEEGLNRIAQAVNEFLGTEKA